MWLRDVVNWEMMCSEPPRAHDSKTFERSIPMHGGTLGCKKQKSYGELMSQYYDYVLQSTTPSYNVTTTFMFLPPIIGQFDHDLPIFQFFHQMLRLPLQVTLQQHQILHLPQKVTLQHQQNVKKHEFWETSSKLTTQHLSYYSTLSYLSASLLSATLLSATLLSATLLSATLLALAATLLSATLTPSYFIAWFSKSSLIGSFPTKLP